jgi:hypothetical protein
LLRTIKAEARFTEQLNLLDINPEHWDDVFRALEFIMARQPQIFPKFMGTKLHLAVVECYKGLPEVHVVFAYDDDCVYLLDAYLGDLGDGSE